MRTHAPFQPEDLQHLDELLDMALQVVPMRDVHAGNRDPRVIGMRHDVDNHIEPAVEMAMWEAERGYRSTYYILHSAPYWQDKPLLRSAVDEIASFGHEIGIHNAALSEAVRDGTDARVTLAEAILELRDMGHRVNGTVAHGASECYHRGKVVVVNDEMFVECRRPSMGAPDRTVGRCQIRPVSLAEFGLDYDANWLDRGAYLSDSGGVWSSPGWAGTCLTFPPLGQLHMLVHPDWWDQAFTPLQVPA